MAGFWDFNVIGLVIPAPIVATITTSAKSVFGVSGLILLIPMRGWGAVETRILVNKWARLAGYCGKS